jgi:hypothetical protein
MSDCPHRRRSSGIVNVYHDPDEPCPQCEREAAEENDMGGNFSRDVFTATAAVYGVLFLVVCIGIGAVIRSCT